MKRTILLLSTLFIFVACKNNKEPEQELPTSPTHEMHMMSKTLYNREAKAISPNFIASYVIPHQIAYFIQPIPIPVPGELNSFPPMPDEGWTAGNYHWKLDSLQFTITFGRTDLSLMNQTCLTNHPAAGGGAEFMKLSKKFNDTYYRGGYWVSDIIPIPMSYLTVTCDKDFDANHPAGTPLNDLIKANFYSAEKFIKSGYSDMEAGDNGKKPAKI